MLAGIVNAANKLRWWIFALVKQIVLCVPFMNRSFVILTSARSGSTYLRLLLDDHPKITCWGELLNRKYLPLCETSSHVLVNYILTALLPIKLWLPYTGFKVFHEQLEFCYLHFGQILTALLHPPIIILFRKNMLETYTSLQISLKTDVWNTEDGSTAKECIEIEWQKFVEYVATIRRRWRRNMTEIPPNSKVLFVSYEELTANKDKSLSKIFEFLNLENCDVKAILKKQNPLPLIERITNYKQIEQMVLQNHLDHTITEQWLRTLWVQGKAHS